MTLADLLMSTALLGLTAGATMITLEQGQRVWAAGATAVETQQSARAALTWLVAELRAAGQGNSGDALPALSAAEPSRLVLHLDRNRDSVIAGAAESVTWLLAGDILRREAGGGAEPVINAVRSLSFTYFDADDRATTDPASSAGSPSPWPHGPITRAPPPRRHSASRSPPRSPCAIHDRVRFGLVG